MLKPTIAPLQCSRSAVARFCRQTKNLHLQFAINKERITFAAATSPILPNGSLLSFCLLTRMFLDAFKYFQLSNILAYKIIAICRFSQIFFAIYTRSYPVFTISSSSTQLFCSLLYTHTTHRFFVYAQKNSYLRSRRIFGRSTRLRTIRRRLRSWVDTARSMWMRRRRARASFRFGLAMDTSRR